MKSNPTPARLRRVVFIGFSLVATLMRAAPSPLASDAPPSGDGLSVIYFSHLDHTGGSVTRVDRQVDFEWGAEALAPGIAPDKFSARWAGRVEPIESGAYTFRNTSHGGVRLWVDGLPIIDHWNDQPPADNDGTVTLEAGKRISIVMEVRHDSGPAAARLLWKRPGQTGFAAIPQARLHSGQQDFPAAAFLANVKSFGARGDGIADDTAAIQAAITANVATHSTVYFPNGVYLVSNTLEWKKPDGKWGVYLSLQGQNRDNTRIVLKSGSAGFNNPDAPRPVFITGDQAGTDHGNQAFQNCFHDLTVEIGSDNAGAVAIDYLASNSGTIKNVTVRARGPALAGISMTRAWPGPCLLKDVRVEGFQYGIKIGQSQYSITLEDIALTDQGVNGIYNDGNAIFLRHQVSRNRVPAIRNLKPQSFAVVLNSCLANGDAAASAIVNAGKLYARDVTVSDYGGRD